MIKKLILLLGLLAVNSASAARFEKGVITNQYRYFFDKKYNIICYERARIALSCVSLDKGVNKWHENTAQGEVVL